MALKVEVVYALPGEARILTVSVPDGATVRDALSKAGVDFKPGHVGVFGETVTADRRLADGDRVEIYRPLELDPKEARRRRALKPRRR